MKKIAFLSILALSMGFVACDNYEEPNPPAQYNPEEPVFETDELKYTPADNQTLNLTAANEGSGTIDLGQFEVKDLPTGYEVNMVMEYSLTQDFAKAYEVATTTGADNRVEVSSQTLNDNYRANVTRDPAPVDIWVRYAAYAVSGSSHVRIGGPDVFFGPVKATLEPVKLIDIEDSYSLIYSADGTTWNMSDAIAFTHSEKNVYDDPAFTFVHEITADMVGENGLYWRIVPQSVLTSGNFDAGRWFGVSEDEAYAETGKLLASSETAGVMFTEGPVMFNINVETLDFNYLVAFESFYTPGDGNGWSHPAPRLFTTDYTNYTGFAHLSGGFKLNPDNGWNGKDFGMAEDNSVVYTTSENGVTTGKGELLGGKNIPVPDNAQYYLTLNYPLRAITLTKINTWGIIGVNGWGDNDDIAMTPSDDFMTWTATITVGADTGWKFRANHAWDIQFGDSIDAIRMDGGSGNITLGEAGTYEVTLNFTTYPYTASAVKK